ncbi:4a-hydroxytetrahydrobiopterin dehydratase [Dactylosporangium sp. NPDC051541]|uniref:4a-hydroxytetrahydrobiopterin dehydratase n=1 Tax=Dactylosporangium sp. NPDC051541 TaxID=3363977 RepID=UPI0037B0C814
MADVLGNDTITAALTELSGWSGDAEGIERSVTASSFLDGIRLVAEVAHVAEQADHHPDIDIRWRTVTFRLSTHSAGGVTGKDLALARQINELIG